MDEHGITLSKKDINESPLYRQELIQIGGKPQVPCLVIDDKALYESDDIITWLRNNYKKRSFGILSG